MAHFTTGVTALRRCVTMNMGFTETKPHEEVDEKRKSMSRFPMLAIMIVLSEPEHFAPVELSYNAPDGGWTDGGDGYWYYNDVLQAGQTTEKRIEYYL
ncbi:MAG: hypothetical protein ACLUD0_06445 [Eubacterium ramulus]